MLITSRRDQEGRGRGTDTPEARTLINAVPDGVKPPVTCSAAMPGVVPSGTATPHDSVLRAKGSRPRCGPRCRSTAPRAGPIAITPESATIGRS